MFVKKLLVVMGVGYCCCAGMVFAAQPYENFSGSQLDSNKWYGRFWDSESLDYVLEVADGELHSMVRASTSKTGFYDSWAFFAESNRINTIQATVKVKSYSFDGRAEVTGQANSIGMGGFFYKDATGDVYAAVGFGDFNDGNGLTAGCQLIAGDGTQQQALFSNFPVSIGETYILGVHYDNKNGIYCRIEDPSDNTNNEEIILYGPMPVAPPEFPFKYIGSTYSISGLTDDTFWAVGGISASFDDVSVNSSGIYDDFNTGPLKSTHWQGPERVREIRDGKFHMNVQNFGADKETSEIAITTDNRTDYLQADVTIYSDTVLTGDKTKGEVRLQGNFFNKKYDVGNYNGWDGEVAAFTRLRRYSDGRMKAIAAVYMCDDANCASDIGLLYEDVPCETKYDTPVTLTIEKKDNTLIFGCDQGSYTYTMPEGPLYEPKNNERKLRSRVYAPSGYGYLKATVDNVYTQKPGFSWPTFLPAILSGTKKE